MRVGGNMRRGWLLLLGLMVGCGGGGGGDDVDAAAADGGVFRDAAVFLDAEVPPNPKCLSNADRGTQCTVTIAAKVIQFETRTDPTSPVSVRYDTAWDIPQIFPTTCTSLSVMSASSAGGFA